MIFFNAKMKKVGTANNSGYVHFSRNGRPDGVEIHFIRYRHTKNNSFPAQTKKSVRCLRYISTQGNPMTICLSRTESL